MHIGGHGWAARSLLRAIILSTQQLRQLGQVRRQEPHLILRQQLGGCIDGSALM